MHGVADGGLQPVLRFPPLSSGAPADPSSSQLGGATGWGEGERGVARW